MNKIPTKTLKAFDKKRKTAPTQERIGSVVVRKKAGRPPKPNMKRYIFKLDFMLQKRLSDYAQKMHMSKSAVVGQALDAFLEKN